MAPLGRRTNNAGAVWLHQKRALPVIVRSVRLPATIRGAPKLITRLRQWPFRGEYGNSACNEPAIDHCDFDYFNNAALCTASAAERRQVEGGRTKGCQHYQWR